MSTFAYVRIHEGLYLVYFDGEQIGEIDNDLGDYWQITFRGDRIENVHIQDLRQAKTFIENMIKRGWSNDDKIAADGVA